MSSERGVITTGARLVLRSWRALAWAYAASLLLGLAATLPAALAVSGILNHSFESQHLAKGFDLGVLFSLLMHPEVSLGGPAAGSFFLSLLYLVFMVFLTGGLLADYHRDPRLPIGKFFEACGAFFWRFMRLLLMLLVVLLPVGILYGQLQRLTGRLADNSPREMPGFWLALGSAAFVLLLLVAIRLWFDIAQVRAVAEDEPRIRRALGKAFRITFGNFFSLFWIFLRISSVALLGWAATLWLYVKIVRPEQVGLSFLLGQVIVFLWLFARLWLRACETLWYQQKFPAPASAFSVEVPAPSAPVAPEPPPSPATPGQGTPA